MSEEQKKKIGRPMLDIDPKLVENLALIHCTYKEIAATVGCSTDTLKDRFSDLIANARERGKMSLKRMAWRSAEKGSDKMIMHLLDNLTEIQLRAYGHNSMEAEVKDVNVSSTIEADIAELKELLDARPKIT